MKSTEKLCGLVACDCPKCIKKQQDELAEAYNDGKDDACDAMLKIILDDFCIMLDTSDPRLSRMYKKNPYNKKRK